MSNTPQSYADVLVVGQQLVLPSQYCAASGAAALGGISLLAGPVFCGTPTPPQFSVGAPMSVLNIVPSASVPAANALTISSDGLGALPYPTQGIIANAGIGHALLATLESGIAISPPSVMILTPTFSLITNEIHVGTKTQNGASVQNGTYSQNGASTKVGAKADTGVRCEASKASQLTDLFVAGPCTAQDFYCLTGTLKQALQIARIALAKAGKGFDIPHPTKEEHRLRYICLEGPEVGAYIRGTLKDSDTIELPDYWRKLCIPESITVNLTPIGRYQELYVEEIIEWGTKVKIRNASGSSIHCHYTVFAERVLHDKLQVEYKGLTPADYPGDNSEYALAGWDYARPNEGFKTSSL